MSAFKRAVRPQLAEVGVIHSDDAGKKDAFHFPGVRVSAAVELQPGEKVRFVSGTLVHPAAAPPPKVDTCEQCWEDEETAKPVTHYVIGKGARRELCEECAEGDDYGPGKPIARGEENDFHAIVDPFIPRPVQAGEVVYVFPVPGLVSGIHHGFTVKPIDGEGRWGWISEADDDYLNDSCRECY
jgi:hypothetical protein